MQHQQTERGGFLRVSAAGVELERGKRGGGRREKKTRPPCAGIRGR